MASTTAASRPVRPIGGKKMPNSSVTITMSDFQTYEMQARQMECKQWIESIINEEINSDIHLALKDGVVLCKMANIMFPGIIPRYNKQTSITFKLLENINSFLSVPKKLGINDNQIFIATDLWENKNIQKVIGTLNVMAHLVASKGFPIKWPTIDDPSMKQTFVENTDKDRVIEWDYHFIFNGNGTPTKSFNRLSINGTKSIGTPSSMANGASKPTASTSTTTILNNKPLSNTSSTTAVGSPIISATSTTNHPVSSPKVIPSSSTTTTVQTTPKPSISPSPPKQQPQEQEDLVTKYEKLSIQSNESLNCLHIAVKQGDVEAVREILKKRKQLLNSVSIHGRSSLHFAVSNQNIEISALLLEQEDIDANITDTDGNTPLHLAVLIGCFALIEMLVKKEGTNVNAVNKDGSTPIMMVSLNGDEKIVDLLIDAGADVKSSNKKGNTALHYATLRGHKKVVDKLIEAGSDVNAVNQDGATSLHVAAEENFPNIVESLANSGAQLDLQRLDGWTPLYSAAYKGNIETAVSLMSKSAPVDSQNLEGWTPLHAACAEGHMEMAKLLIEHYKAHINKQNIQGTTPFFHACSSGHLSLVKYLLANGADPELSKANGWKPIHIACYNENDHIVKHLIEETNVDLNCTNNEIKGYAPIHILISTEVPRIEVIELILKKGIDVNKKNVNGSTPLHLAVFWNHFQVLELLLAYNANLSEKNNKGRTPLNLACHYGNENIAKFLAEKTNVDPRKLKIKNNKQKILDMEIPDAPPVPIN